MSNCPFCFFPHCTSDEKLQDKPTPESPLGVHLFVFQGEVQFFSDVTTESVDCSFSINIFPHHRIHFYQLSPSLYLLYSTTCFASLSSLCVIQHC